MNCTGEANRERICREYCIQVIGCFILLDGQKIISDAGKRIITDKYYLFKCINRATNFEEIIKCGHPTAKHICELSANEMPAEFNPFQGMHIVGAGGDGGVTGVHWDRARRQLHNAIMLFITRYSDILKPDSTIYKIKASIENDITAPVQQSEVLAVNTIIGKFSTTIADILNDLANTRAVRNFNFNCLNQILIDRGVLINNYN